MKDPLDYTEDELKNLSKDELNILFNESARLESRYNTHQLAEKTVINALYGCLANRYFPLFNEAMAGAITGNGRYFIRKLANYIEEKLQSLHPAEKNYIIYGDTDSCYFHIEPFMEMYQVKNPDLDIDHYVDWADNFEKKVIQPCIQQCIDDFAKELNAFDKDAIGVDREIIADAAVFTNKKKYYARVRDSEGTRYPADEPYIKVMGLEIIKSTTPLWSKKYLKEAIPHILDKDENDLRLWLASIKQNFIEVDPNQIAASGSVSNLSYKLGVDKGIPIGARAAIVHNNYVKEHKLTDVYEYIRPADKCKRLFLVEPNPFNSNIVAYTNDAFVKEIKGYIDYDTNFEKNFMKPMNIMVKSLGWDLEQETQRLDEW